MLKKICLICAAVVISWSVMLGLMWSGYAVDRTLLAILMGMSVGAVATKYNFGLVWKSATVVLGLAGVWYLINDNPVYGLLALGALVLLTILFKFKLNDKKEVPQSDRFKDCC